MKIRISLAIGLMASALSLPLSSCDDDDSATPTAIPEAVDLGLSVRWASFNLGASTPEGAGGYYSWGETSVKPAGESNWKGYKLCEDIALWTFTKYNERDGLSRLEASDDAAHVNLGGGWRMPTYEECLELVNNCSPRMVQQNGAWGYIFTGANGNTIFIPLVGYLETDGTLVYHWADVGDAAKGCYWSSDLHPENDTQAKDLFLFMGYTHGNYDQWFRYAAQPIRPVCE
ncbi:MAG: hypothetical protein ACI35Q_09865 [Marinilabiliaceae bacterium]